MREIKFRAWDKIDKKMRIVTRMTFGLEPTGHPPIIVHLDDGKEPVIRSINDVDLIQYTGLKDKNGKEIYEGDILGLPQGGTRGVVRFGEHNVIDDYYMYSAYGWYLKDGKTEAGILTEDLKTLKVIGNIHENPELLK